MAIQQRRHVDGRQASVQTVRDAIAADAASDGVPSSWSWSLFWFPAAGAVVMGIIFLVRRRFFYSVQLEDHPIEWVQFALCAFTCLVSAFAAWRFYRSGRPWLAALMVVVALGGLVLSGEEISWGQRVFGIVTPADLDHANQQGEMNLHDIDVGIDPEKISELLELVIGVAGVALSLLARPVRAPLNRTTWWLLAPPLFTIPGFAAMPVYQAVMIAGVTLNPLVAFQEYVELTLYLSMAVTALTYYARATAGRYPVDLSTTDSRQRAPQGQIGLMPIVATGAAVAVLTIVFAIMTVHSGVLPGNLPAWARQAH